MTKTIYGIYDASDPAKAIRYVGQTKVPLHLRLWQHENNGSNKCLREWFFVLKYNDSRPAIVELGTASEAAADEAEMWWIRLLRDERSDAVGLLNATVGGKSGARILDANHWRALRRMWHPKAMADARS